MCVVVCVCVCVCVCVVVQSWFKNLEGSQWNDFDPESERREEVGDAW